MLRHRNHAFEEIGQYGSTRIGIDMLWIAAMRKADPFTQGLQTHRDLVDRRRRGSAGQPEECLDEKHNLLTPLQLELIEPKPEFFVT